MHLCISIGRIIGSMARSCYPVFGDYYRSFVFGTRSVLCLWYLTRGKQNGMSFPIAGLGSLLFGLWLMIMPAFFVGILMYVLGAVLVLAGISQIVNLSAARSWTVVPGGFFVVPVLVLIAGVVVLFNPFTAATVPFIILGVSSIVYGLSDLVNIIRFRQKKDIQTPIIEDVTPIEEIKD